MTEERTTFPRGQLAGDEIEGYTGERKRQTHEELVALSVVQANEIRLLRDEVDQLKGVPARPPRERVGETTCNGHQAFWERLGADRVCSYCGCLHPEDLEALYARIDTDVDLDPTTKRYKIYIRRPEVPNGSVGSIKFYAWHAPDEAFVERLNQAIRRSVLVQEKRRG